MGGLKRGDYWIMLASLFMAVLLWVYVTSVQATPEQSLMVKLNAVGLAPGLTVSGLPVDVDVRVQGGSFFSGLSKSGVSAVVDFSGGKPGENLLPIQVSAPLGVHVIQVIPSQVVVYIDQLSSRWLPVNVDVLGQVAQGYQARTPVVSPGMVLVKGPQKLLASLTHAEVDVNLSGTSRDLVENLPVDVGSGGFSVSPGRVQVRVPVEQTPARAVAVVPRITGSPLSGYQVGKIVTSPDTVLVYGSAQQLAGLTFVNTMPVSVDGCLGDTTQEAQVVLPPGVTRADPGNVSVTVQIVPSSGQ